jgi:hypothetical protein
MSEETPDVPYLTVTPEGLINAVGFGYSSVEKDETDPDWEKRKRTRCITTPSESSEDLGPTASYMPEEDEAKEPDPESVEPEAKAEAKEEVALLTPEAKKQKSIAPSSGQSSSSDVSNFTPSDHPDLTAVVGRRQTRKMMGQDPEKHPEKFTPPPNMRHPRSGGPAFDGPEKVGPP